MPTANDLMGTGVPPMLAGELGNSPQSVAAAGTSQATAAAVYEHLVEMTATGIDGVILPSAAKIGTPYWVYNSSGSTGTVYCPVGHTLNSTANGGLGLATHKAAVFMQFRTNQWWSNLTA
jgi:hypothetical protein